MRLRPPFCSKNGYAYSLFSGKGYAHSIFSGNGYAHSIFLGNGYAQMQLSQPYPFR